MAQKPLDPTIGEAPLIAGRLHRDQDEWVRTVMPKLGIRNRAELLRRMIAVAQRHEEELIEAS